MPFAACKKSSELREFWTDVKSLVLTKMVGTAIDMSPGQTNLSRLAPSTIQLVPPVMV
jgi:hypothetical protein